ncbi:MAG TPA: tetraacyldisaccharide 4'-kinase [Casimicrobiaceae bacterium]|jgi:tetraacyldisaccharide 4'-kinase|nr:tetraacyldisaccharide 4'-kinase [Casimicrobiaceae bacterium]
MTAAAALTRRWYRSRLCALTALLVPASWLYGAVVRVRRGLYAAGWMKRRRVARLVVVVGNLTVGGGGKTPAAIALARALAARGAAPGLVSRGYGGRSRTPREVRPDDDPAIVGDEPLILARSGFPVVVGRDRAAAAELLIARHPQTSVIVCDDGLQHLALARDVEIVVVDDARGFGNGWLLPAGPLREPASRLAQVDAIARLADAQASAGDASADGRETRIVHRALPWRRVGDDAEVAGAPGCWRGARVAALAGIAHPQRFFATLRAQGIDAATTALDDHHAFTPADLPADADVVLMTEKDAVKCRRFDDPRLHYLPIEAVIDPRLVERVAALIAA